MEIDFTQTEIDIIKKHVDGRWQKKDHGVHMGDIEVGGKEKPAAIWEDTYYTFIIIKIAAFTYKNMFYFMRDKRFDTGTDEYSDLNECVDSIMKAQADFSLSKNTKGLKVEINKE
ncbi:hypothetical protein [bacterium endosymbiont of Bathymodiolus sp. 5 South]|jgi:hypothetical protein|uniref:hypothetical protein n=1 Tax=bacterium endosymbiont of Bathymodiolus sp. 5 South TaxID=1181670 RepID=UPI0010BB85C1|nr:hypothetical protein [bacterium endosymbiont of Bathymodiolus sp. 5 South]CAC9436896.1 hypothetical protein [uncultured Gammaproteobacteria bacterium]CAC9639087.1 hypothetical protein [uncultured Gammaproteobacteria bacterium]SHN90428.1 hypothetical protein BCLUESOX_535 [bacterium endosymbiont of Bathymodiolus sp. 5 South]VVH55340.1 hypothetical protein BSPCLSOX_1188 [uncultured Gammaproteobacteria bacterium]VVH62354.1 hypothetical protein BSPWISOX_893 [uncultured Gammaproteobacteria bacter